MWTELRRCSLLVRDFHPHVHIAKMLIVIVDLTMAWNLLAKKFKHIDGERKGAFRDIVVEDTLAISHTDALAISHTGASAIYQPHGCIDYQPHGCNSIANAIMFTNTIIVSDRMPQ